MTVTVSKGLLKLRRVKAAGPVMRQGVTRMGRVGVEIEHEGVKGWGLNESAAQASWEQNRAGKLAKRYQDGSGTAVGRRIIEKAQQRPAAAGRPIAGSGVLKSKKLVVAANAMPSIAAQVEQPMMPQQVGKADRYYDPEDRRQRRLGAAAASGGLVGARMTYTGGRDIARDTRHVRSLPHDFVQPRGNGRWIKVPNRVEQNRAVQFVREGVGAADKPLLVRPSRLVRAGAGAALVAASAAVVRRGNDPRRRRWT